MAKNEGFQGQTGVTLVELMILLVIIGVTLSLAVPAYQGMTARNRVATSVNDMIVAINLARNEALRVSQPVNVLADAPVAGDEFGNGWCVVVGNSPADCTGALRKFDGLGGALTLKSVEGVTSLQFNGLGALTNLGGGSSRSLDMCSPGQTGRRIFINMMGRAKSHKPDDADTNKQPAC